MTTNRPRPESKQDNEAMKTLERNIVFTTIVIEELRGAGKEKGKDKCESSQPPRCGSNSPPQVTYREHTERAPKVDNSCVERQIQVCVKMLGCSGRPTKRLKSWFCSNNGVPERNQTWLQKCGDVAENSMLDLDK